MRLSKGGIDFISKWEGRENEVYKDVAGYPTIGVGHLLTHEELQSGKIMINNQPFRYGSGLQNEQVDALLLQDTDIAQQAVNKYVHASLSQPRFDMLTSLCFNIGVGAFKRSTLVRVLNRGNVDDVPTQLLRWVYSGGKKVQGLINRRTEAAKIWKGELEQIAKYYPSDTKEQEVRLANVDHVVSPGDRILVSFPYTTKVYEGPNGQAQILIERVEV